MEEDKQNPPLKREEPVKCGFHRRVMKKSFSLKQVLGLLLFMF